MSKPAPRVFLDIGLPKTGTTHHQLNTYPFLDPTCIAYNPGDIIYPLREILPSVRVIKSKKGIEETKINIRNTLAGFDSAILISDESISVDGYSPYYEENMSFLAQLFPDAEILLTLRNQFDWCRSMYKQSVHQGNVQPAHRFFYFGSNRIERTKNWYEDSKGCLPRLDVYRINWPELIQDYRSHFGAKSVHIFFYEDPAYSSEELNPSQNNIIGRLNKCLGVRLSEEIRAQREEDFYHMSEDQFHARWNLSKSQLVMPLLNRSMSMLGIKCSIAYVWARKMLGAGRIPYRRRVSPRKGWREKMSIAGTWWFWRSVWQRYIDRFLYLDWDCMRASGWDEVTSGYFFLQNQALQKVVECQTMPKEYFVFPKLKNGRGFISR